MLNIFNSNDQHRYHERAVLWLRFMHLLPCIVVEIKYPFPNTLYLSIRFRSPKIDT